MAETTQGSRLRRREFVIAGAGAGLVLAGPGPLNYAALARSRNLPVATEGAFAHGVASGFPAPNAITLWTRVSELARSSRLTLEVAKDKHFRHVVKRSQVVADSARDYTVHARLAGLKPSTEYFYRFETKKKHSRVGTFRTLPPADSNQTIRIGYYSCQAYEAGYYLAQGALAKEKDLDLVLMLGDYIYEHHYYDGPAARVDKTGANKDGDVQTLAEYRQKYRFYQTDKHLQDLHAAYPFVVIWDDHEVEDNYAGTQPDSASKDPEHEENNNSYPRRVPFGARRKNGYKAFFEAMPMIEPRRDRMYGSIKLGKMAELFITDERQYRDPQPCNDVQLQSCPDDMQPGRTFLGSTQKSWVKTAIPKSKARWKLFASETMMMSLDSVQGQHANQDQWDGYSAERQEILTEYVNKKVQNLVVLSGDLHAFVAGNLYTNGETSGTPVGTEMLAGSATSFGLPEELHVPSSALQAIAASANPHVVYSELDHRGYGVVTVSKNELQGEFKAVSSALDPNGTVSSLARFSVESGTPQLHKT
jgi:alkaline phosphatase D